MTDKSVIYPFRSTKTAPGATPTLAQLSHARGLKHGPRLRKSGRAAQADIAFLCSAFLAERGCYGPATPHKHSEA